MKKSLFGEGRFYKANLHSHCVISDGHETPEEMKKIYKDLGYQVLAYSDHDIMIPHPELRDEDFLPLTSFEYEFTEEDTGIPYSFRKCYHMVFIADKEDKACYPWPNPDFVWGNARKYIQPFYKGDKPHDYNIDSVNAAIADAHEKGFLVTYCHPHWSTQTYPDYCGIEGADFVEAFNTGCLEEGWDLDASDYVYNDFLMLKKHPAPTASDDGHYELNYGGGATYIRAKSLDYDSIFTALKNQDVYASWGPEIKDIQFDPETMELSVSSSDAESIMIVSERRFAKRAFHKGGMHLSEAVFDLKEYLEDTKNAGIEDTAFIRVIVNDGAGRKALSRGYFVKELLNL